nr:DUF222 domain-containing protein [uncultured Microbacterium sp.]
MNSTRTLLDRVVADLDRVLSDDALAGLRDGDRVEVLLAAGAAFRRAEAVIVETVATADATDFPHSAGCRTLTELLERTVLTDVGGATRLIKVVDLVRRPVSLAGERLPARWPALREALLRGDVGVAGMLAATGPVEAIRDRIGAAERLEADDFLARAARGLLDSDSADADAPRGPMRTPEDLNLLAQIAAATLDPDGPEPDDDEPARRRGVTIGRLRDGLRTIKGNLTPDVAAQLDLILDAMLNPKGDGPPVPSGVAFAPSDGSRDTGSDGSDGADGSDGTDGAHPDEDSHNSDPRTVIDGRTPAQKRHDALAAALGIAARHKEMPSLGGASPTLTVNIDVKDLAAGRGRATVGGSASVPTSVAAQAGCSGTIQRVLFDEGRIIGINTTDRVFTVHQRRAIIARDKECLIPGCHVPASWCEIHHVTEHARGGPTHTDNGVPLCWWHHRSLDSSGWEIRMNAGIPQVRGPGWWDPAYRWHTPRLSDLPHRENHHEPSGLGSTLQTA